ncbi:MAG: BLUF domain-containing protein [Pseudomonadota bacterium]
MHLYHLVYFSKRGARDPAVLADILRVAQRNNARGGITGLLFVDDNQYIQVLEGPRSVLSDLLSRIMRDPRHSELQITLFEELNYRKFKAWDMAILDGDSTEVSRIFRYYTADVASLSQLSGVVMWEMIEQMADAFLSAPSDH